VGEVVAECGDFVDEGEDALRDFVRRIGEFVAVEVELLDAVEFTCFVTPA
jgi:hypothetical protein